MKLFQIKQNEPGQLTDSGNPVEIKVRGYNLTLRKQDAEQIFVQASS